MLSGKREIIPNLRWMFILLCLVQLARLANAQKQGNTTGLKAGRFINPIFAGDYPDPSILRDGEDYYMVHSSFEYYPGLLIWHSRDLINWSPVTNALHKVVGSVWAPDIVKHKDKYYIYFPANYNIYVVWANNINGPWSDPVNLKVSSIDPGHVVDNEGRRFLFFNNGGYVPLSEDGLSVIGEMKNSYSGWKIPREWSIECFCLEGPKLMKRGDYFYLTVAEGGTAGPATGHMVISARSKSLDGPWENSPYNPIIRTTSSAERWWSKGHGTLVEDARGKWWMVYHAYENGFLNLGRQTLLEPVEWTEGGWFKAPKYRSRHEASPFQSTYSISDDFSGNQLKPHWKFFGEYDSTRFHLANNSISILAKGDGIGNSAPLLCNPSHHSYITEVEISLKGDATAALALYYNNQAFSGILAQKGNILVNIHGWQFLAETAVFDKHVFLRLVNRNNTVDLYYSTDGAQWKKMESSLEISGFNHNAFGGFLGVRIGLCSIGKGEVQFKNFNYLPIME